jgi:cell pole-organizing protein PopZ
MSFGIGPLLDRDAGRGMEVRLGMTKSDTTGAQSLEEILAQIKKSVAGEAGAGGEASGRPVDGGLSARLAGVLKDRGTATAPADDGTEAAGGANPQGPAAAGPAKPAQAARQAADPLWFLRQAAGTGSQDDAPTPGAQTAAETAAASMDREIRLSRPQDLRASLPPLFGAEDQPLPLARMPAPETQQSPPQTAPDKMPPPDNSHTAKTQPLILAPEPERESPDGTGTAEPKPAPEVQAAAPAAAAPAEPSREASPSVEAKLDDSLQLQAQVAAMTMPPTPLAEPANVKSTSPGAGPQARTLEQVIGELLEPVIRQWLEDNLPRLVEEVVRKEVARAIAAERPTSVV